MTTVNITEFRANLLKYLEKAGRGEEITVTTNGKVLATIIAPADPTALARKRLDELAASARVGDVISPVDSQWDAKL